MNILIYIVTVYIIFTSFSASLQESLLTHLNEPLRAPDVFLRPKPHIIAKPTCNCVEFAKQFPEEYRERKNGHTYVKIKDDDDSWIIVESNWRKCTITYRRIYKN